MTTPDELGDALSAAYQPLWEAREAVQKAAYDYVVALARQAWPTATILILGSSDQAQDRGWVLEEVIGSDRTTPIEDWESSEPEDIWRPLSDLDWTHPRIDDQDGRGNSAELDLQSYCIGDLYCGVKITDITPLEQGRVSLALADADEPVNVEGSMFLAPAK